MNNNNIINKMNNNEMNTLVTVRLRADSGYSPGLAPSQSQLCWRHSVLCSHFFILDHRLPHEAGFVALHVPELWCSAPNQVAYTPIFTSEMDVFDTLTNWLAYLVSDFSGNGVVGEIQGTLT